MCIGCVFVPGYRAPDFVPVTPEQIWSQQCSILPVHYYLFHRLHYLGPVALRIHKRC